MTVFHPRQWATNWPPHERPYATLELCRLAHPEVPESDIEKTAYVGDDAGVVKDESELAVSALVPTEPAAPVSDPVSVPTPKSKSKKSK